MVKIIHGTIRGRVIELDEDVGFKDGQPVCVQVTPVPSAAVMTNRLVESAGALAKDWTDEDDRILDEIYQDRKRDSRNEILNTN
jgi:hypothetical protein